MCTPCTVQLVGNQQNTIDGIMVEARENTSSFEEGSTIWGTWVNDPNSFYHAVECNRSSTSSEGPLYEYIENKDDVAQTGKVSYNLFIQSKSNQDLVLNVCICAVRFQSQKYPL